MPSTTGADTEAIALYSSLISGEDVAFPTIDLSGAAYTVPSSTGNPLYTLPSALTNDDLTTKVVGGTGTFDVLMSSVRAHLKEEYDASRITGAEYSKTYVALVQAAMGNAVQYLTNRDTAYWQAVATQLQSRLVEAQVIAARIASEVAKVQYVGTKFEALTAKANYTLSKAKLATEGVQYAIGNYNLGNILPQQKLQLVAETSVTTNNAAKITEETSGMSYTRSNIMPSQKAQIDAQTSLANAQVTLTGKQGALVDEQKETARAQTTNTRSDGTTTIVGVLGKQKDLYTQQITSYQRDAETKAAKLFTDAWITQKTIDNGLLAPTGFQNTSVDAVLSKIKTNNGLT